MVPGVVEREFIPKIGELRIFARRLCRDEHQSNDLVQETMLKALLGVDSFREGTNSRAWLFQICKNTFMNQVRRKKIEPVPSSFQEPDGHLPQSSEQTPVMESDVYDSTAPSTERLFGDEVCAALMSIPADCQVVVLLRDIEGYSYAELAAIMNAPLGTVRSRIHRGRKALALLLGPYALNNGVGRPDRKV